VHETLRNRIYGAATERELKSQAVNMTLATPPSKTAASLISYRSATGNKDTIEEEDEEEAGDQDNEDNRQGAGRSIAEALAAEFVG
jgi:hypothetical protein